MRKNIFSRFCILLIRFYQYVISPYFPGTCRYTPTCSEYGIQCFRKHPFFKALYYTIKRIASCHPCGGSGYDPCP